MSLIIVIALYVVFGVSCMFPLSIEALSVPELLHFTKSGLAVSIQADSQRRCVSAAGPPISLLERHAAC